MSTPKINSMVKFNMVCLLAQGPKHGYELIKLLTSAMDKSISASHIYPFLKELEDKKYIDFQKREERDKKKYFLTQKGQGFIRELLFKMSHVMDSFLQEKTALCYGCDSRIYEGGHTEIINEERQIFCCRHCADAYKQRQAITSQVTSQASWQPQDQLKTASRF